MTTLTEEIRQFTAGAYERLPAGYIDSFRNLIERLIEESFASNAPKAGDAFPDFILQDNESKMIKASEYWHDKNLIVKFYRGGWCPYCHLELVALERYAQEFAAENTRLFAIAPEKPSFQLETKKAANANFKFLWDENNRLARQLGIAFAVDGNVRNVYLKLNLDLDSVNGEWVLPVPATFIIKNGIVSYSFLDADYMRRQEPADLLAAIRTIGH
ncbi:MAG TPA: peroxiredoxin-like family protein [Novimethylophilus sp.]|uniref:peroxiredoxin-like family protein n=1 Tax=Novimethylophilus sp. TaxID=2137426 RepID=UPI002F3E5EDE